MVKKETEKMEQKSIYLSESCWKILARRFERGKVSANLEKIIRHYCSNPAEEKKEALAELQYHLREFNGVWNESFELIKKESEEIDNALEIKELKEGSA